MPEQPLEGLGQECIGFSQKSEGQFLRNWPKSQNGRSPANHCGSLPPQYIPASQNDSFKLYSLTHDDMVGDKYTMRDALFTVGHQLKHPK